MDLYNKTISELTKMLSKKEISVKDIVESTFTRIDEVEEKVKSYVTLNKEQALKRAEELDSKGIIGERKPLYGIPMALKDNMCTKGIRTTCSSKILENFVPPYNATVVDRLNKDCSVLLGKTNLDEFAKGSSTENSAFFTTKNPWDLDRVPGGSSGGSAAAVAAGEAIFALGSDTGGSVRQPASFNGVVGLKPTYGAVSRYGIVAFASSLDQVGPLTKDVTDCALVMNSISGHDKKDSTSVKREKEDYTKYLKEDVKGLKIGVPFEFFEDGIEPDVKKSVLNGVKKLEELGAESGDVSLPKLDYSLAAYYIISPAETSSNLARFDGIQYGVRTDDFIDLNDLYQKTRKEGFGPEVKRRIMLGTYALSSGYYDAYYLKAQKVRTKMKNEFNKAFEKYDILIFPTAPTTAFRIGENTDDPLSMYLNDVFTMPVNMLGCPSISIPCGFDSNNLPIGLQIVGKHFDEGKLLQTAYTFEQNTDYHTKRPGL